MTEITDNNYLNMRRDRRDRYVYRILSLEHFFQMFESNSNVLVKPALWEDPFENFIMNSKFRSSDGDVTGVPPVQWTPRLSCSSSDDVIASVLCRASVTEFRMFTNSIVEYFDVLENRCSRFTPGFIMTSVD